MLKAVAVAMLFVLVNCSDKDSSDVNYDKQDEWTGTCNLAESKKQSPVDVITPQGSSELDGKFVDLSKSYNFFNVHWLKSKYKLITMYHIFTLVLNIEIN